MSPWTSGTDPFRQSHGLRASSRYASRHGSLVASLAYLDLAVHCLYLHQSPRTSLPKLKHLFQSHLAVELLAGKINSIPTSKPPNLKTVLELSSPMLDSRSLGPLSFMYRWSHQFLDVMFIFFGESLAENDVYGYTSWRMSTLDNIPEDRIPGSNSSALCIARSNSDSPPKQTLTDKASKRMSNAYILGHAKLPFPKPATEAGIALIESPEMSGLCLAFRQFDIDRVSDKFIELVDVYVENLDHSGW